MKASIGSYILAGGAAVSLAAVILYRSAYSTSSNAYIFIIAGIVVAVLAALGSMKSGTKLLNWCGPVASCLMAVGLAWSLTSMVDAIGYVISGLYNASTLTTYITFCVVGGIGWLLYVLSSFTGVVKAKKE